MGYNTDFSGNFNLHPAINSEQKKIYDDFQNKRHDYTDKPGLYCQWVISDDGKSLEWDGGEKFYNYIEWLEFINNTFFKQWKISITGFIQWDGDDFGDSGIIYISKNGLILNKTFQDFIDSLKLE